MDDMSHKANFVTVGLFSFLEAPAIRSA